MLCSRAWKLAVIFMSTGTFLKPLRLFEKFFLHRFSIIFITAQWLCSGWTFLKSSRYLLEVGKEESQILNFYFSFPVLQWPNSCGECPPIVVRQLKSRDVFKLEMQYSFWRKSGGSWCWQLCYGVNYRLESCSLCKEQIRKSHQFRLVTSRCACLYTHKGTNTCTTRRVRQYRGGGIST